MPLAEFLIEAKTNITLHYECSSFIMLIHFQADSVDISAFTTEVLIARLPGPAARLPSLITRLPTLEGQPLGKAGFMTRQAPIFLITQVPIKYTNTICYHFTKASRIPGVVINPKSDS